MTMDDSDPAKLGNAMLMLPLISVQLGHASARNSITYLEGADDPERRFMVDVLKGRKTPEILDEWLAARNERKLSYAS